MRTNDFCPPEHSVLFALKSEISDRYDPTPTFLKRVDRALIVGKTDREYLLWCPRTSFAKIGRFWSILRKYRKSLNLTIFAKSCSAATDSNDDSSQADDAINALRRAVDLFAAEIEEIH